MLVISGSALVLYRLNVTALQDVMTPSTLLFTITVFGIDHWCAAMRGISTVTLME